MKYKIEFKTDEELEFMLEKYRDKFNFEIMYLTAGNFLIFSDDPKPLTLEQILTDKISILEQQNSQLEEALVELASIVGGA